MPISAIITQPSSNSLNAAYCPVVFIVTATATGGGAQPPVVYCDIYFNGWFYKTMSKTSYELLTSTNSQWKFDIQDAAQEYLEQYIAPNGLAQMIQVNQLLLKAFCRFRSSGYNSSGFVAYEGTAPIQGTNTTIPVDGDGTESNTIFLLNATLQHDDNQDLASHLESFKRRTWTASAAPLSHRPDNYKQSLIDSDFFPIVYTGDDIPWSMVLNYRLQGQSTWRTRILTEIIACPNLTNLGVGLLNNGDGTQTITFTFDPLPSTITGLNLGYRTQGSTGAFTSVTGSMTSPRTITLPLGQYEFQFQTQGACIGNVLTLANIGVPTTPCTAVAISGTPSLPDAIINSAYSYTINLTGSAPFALSSVVKPSWMTIIISGSQVQISGTPTTNATGVAVSFRVNNCFTGNHVDFSDSIDVNGESNALLVTIQPGTMDIDIAPSSCWLWTGTVTIKDHTGATIYTNTWTSHLDVHSQIEQISLTGLPADTYSLEWNLNSVQNCVSVAADVDYTEDFGTPVTRTSTYTQSLPISGNITKQVELIINNA